MFTDKVSGIPYVLCTSFLITLLDTYGNKKYAARSTKAASELEKKLTLEKLELERRYWEQKSVSWAIVTQKDIPMAKVKNIEWVHTSLNSPEDRGYSEEEMKFLCENFIQMISGNSKKIRTLISEFDKEKALAAQAIKENEEKLIAHSISIIDSSSSTIPDMKSALQTLNSLVSQISTDSVKNKAKDYIASGNKKLSDMIAKEPKPSASANETYKATYTMQATAYTGGTLTALGLKPVRDPSGLSTIAVDPSVIPLGSKVYIPGYGYAICSDTGSAIKGNIIDLYLNSEDECINWGRRNITLYIVAYPGEW
jgi:3D (Asp-Asp-Asp) domain-containing protein